MEKWETFLSEVWRGDEHMDTTCCGEARRLSGIGFPLRTVVSILVGDSLQVYAVSPAERAVFIRKVSEGLGA